MIKLPKHKCSLHISHNAHKDFYRDAEEYILQMDLAFKTDAHRIKAIETNEIWEIQWYPDTPIGSYSVAAPTLEELLEYANED